MRRLPADDRSDWFWIDSFDYIVFAEAELTEPVDVGESIEPEPLADPAPAPDVLSAGAG